MLTSFVAAINGGALRVLRGGLDVLGRVGGDRAQRTFDVSGDGALVWLAASVEIAVSELWASRALPEDGGGGVRCADAELARDSDVAGCFLCRTWHRNRRRGQLHDSGRMPGSPAISMRRTRQLHWIASSRRWILARQLRLVILDACRDNPAGFPAPETPAHRLAARRIRRLGQSRTDQ